MKLERQRRDWEDLARFDALWAVLTDPRRAGTGWELDEFFLTGEHDVERLLAVARELGRPHRWERALDFGCGVGRVTRALAARFERAHGLDISARMVEQARGLNADRPNCTFEVSVAPDLAALESR